MSTKKKWALLISILLLITLTVLLTTNTFTTTGNVILNPGNGWNGPTTTPAAIGANTQNGYDATVIAHWDAIPYQTIYGTFNIGVLAYHLNGIEKVSLSVNNGPWVDITQKTINPRTGIEEYWATIDATRFQNAQEIEVRAIAYPKIAGQPKVLQGTTIMEHDSSMMLHVDKDRQLDYNIRYVTTTGNDNNNCESITTACATILEAMNKAATNGKLDGAEIRLGTGTWQLPETNSFTANERWFTITSIETTTKENVIIEGSQTTNGQGIELKLLKLSRISLANTMRASDPAENYFWLDNSKGYYQGTPIPQGETPCGGATFLGGYGHAGPFSGSYMTDVWMTNTCTGPRANTLIRNVHAEYTGDGHASGTHTVLKYTAKTTEGTVPGQVDYHSDLYQFWDATDDIIIYKSEILPGGNFRGRGTVDDQPPISNIVIDKSYVDVGVPGTADGGRPLSLCNDIDHLLIIDSEFVGAAGFCEEAGGWATVANPSTMKNILLENTLFEQNHWPNWRHYYPEPYPAPADITYTNVPITCTTGETRPCYLQEGVCSGLTRTCDNGEFTLCEYTNIPTYEETETTLNDDLDNDCDGIIDTQIPNGNPDIIDLLVVNTNSCSETDGGATPTFEGTTTGEFYTNTWSYTGSIQDGCLNENILLEGICGSSIAPNLQNLAGLVYLDCSSVGKICSQGRCVT